MDATGTEWLWKVHTPQGQFPHTLTGALFLPLLIFSIVVLFQYMFNHFHCDAVFDDIDDKSRL